jgi:sugar-specific transcriptional regulator TrmB
MAALDQLRSFGLSAYEAQAYLTLLAMGPADAAALGQRAGIPFGRVYDVLNGLVARHLAQVREGRPKTFVPVPPREGLELLVHARKRELAEQAEELARVAPGLEEELGKLSRGAHLRGAPYVVTLGRQDARRTLADVVGEAKRDIVASLEFERFDPTDKVIFEAIQQASERGVRIRAILQRKDLRYILESEYVGLVAQSVLPYLGENLGVRVSDGAPVPFSVADEDRVTLGVRDPIHPDQHFAVVVLRDAKVARDLRGKFDQLWREAVDIWELLDEAGDGTGPGPGQPGPASPA